jgi:hypothetical protein
MSRDSVEGIVTRYGLDGSGIECWWKPDIPYPSRPALESIQAPYSGHRISYPGLKRSGRYIHPLASSVKDEERAELHVYSPSGPSRLVLG